jgi:hypothetical protein
LGEHTLYVFKFHLRLRSGAWQLLQSFDVPQRDNVIRLVGVC